MQNILLKTPKQITQTPKCELGVSFYDEYFKSDEE